jgi:hypothetical protein
VPCSNSLIDATIAHFFGRVEIGKPVRESSHVEAFLWSSIATNWPILKHCPPSQLTKLRCEELESRDCPTLFAVYLFTPGVGMTGDTAATISGSLTVDPTLATDANGATLIEASSIQDALDRSIIGTVTVQHAGETLTYSMGVGESGVNAAAHKAFRVGAGAIELEDMTRSANGSDFDYNDHYWSTNVSEVSAPSMNPPSPPPPTSPPPPGGGPAYVWMTNGAGTTETGPANGWLTVNRSNTLGALTVNFAVDTTGNMPMATLNLDYEIVGNGTSVTFAAGASQARIYVHPLIDTLEEPIEIVKMRLTPGSGYIVYTPNNAFLELGDVKLNFDLDVDADSLLAPDDPNCIDRAKNYLPGYKGPVAMLTTEAARTASFNDSVFAPQRMKLVLENIGTDNPDIYAVSFLLINSTNSSGYASNRSDASIEGAGKMFDYSFRVDGDGPDPFLNVAVARGSVEEQSFGGAYRGVMEQNRTWVNFYCKDYGGAALVRAYIYVKDGAGSKLQAQVDLKIPKDVDGDNLADKWEYEMGARWRTQYGIPAGAPGWVTEAEVRDKFHPDMDDERLDPDLAGVTAAGPLVQQGIAGDEGDAHTMFEEYRGYILDGGGLNGFGGGGHPGGHIRLDPARKEILVEVDRAAVLNNVPGAGIDTNAKLKTILNGASGVFSNNTRGAGIYMYWLMDEVALAAPTQAQNDSSEALEISRDTASARLSATPNLATDFIHALFVDKDLGASADSRDFGDLVRRGITVSTTEMNTKYGPGNGFGVVNIPEAFMTVVAHEIVHMLFILNSGGVWDAREHVTGPLATYETELMYYTPADYTPTKKNRELATVTILPIVQQEIKVKSSL